MNNYHVVDLSIYIIRVAVKKQNHSVLLLKSCNIKSHTKIHHQGEMEFMKKEVERFINEPTTTIHSPLEQDEGENQSAIQENVVQLTEPPSDFSSEQIDK